MRVKDGVKVDGGEVEMKIKKVIIFSFIIDITV